MFTKTKSWVFSHKILSVVIIFFSLIIISIALTPVPPKTATVVETKAEEQPIQETKTKSASIEEWDALIALTKSAKIIYKDSKEYEAYDIYVDRNWFTMKFDEKKNMITKFSIIKKEITGFYNIKFKDSGTGEIVAELKGFDKSIHIYK